MSHEQAEPHFQIIRHWLMKLRQENVAGWEEIDTTLEDLQVAYEDMQTHLEATKTIEEELLRQNQWIAAGYDHYYDLFQSAPIAYLITDAEGMILEANEAIAQLLNVPQPYLAGKPLALYVAEGDRSTFHTCLNQLSQKSGIQVWQINVCPRDGQPFATEWHIATLAVSAKQHDRKSDGESQNLRIAIYNLSQSQPENSQLESGSKLQTSPPLQLPHSLDGLQVLVVEDEADICEFITAIFEAHGISVRTVAGAAAALVSLEQFRPDVLLSDIRMPDGDGYSLIQQIRALERLQGGHIPAAAMSAYLEEDREKAIKAGFEAHLHKLAQPSEWVELVTQLAKQASSLGQG